MGKTTVCYNEHFVPPLAKKWGGGQKKFSARSARKICPPTFNIVTPPLGFVDCFAQVRGRHRSDGQTDNGIQSTARPPILTAP